MEAYFNVWLLGDYLPFMFSMFNVSTHYLDFGSTISSIIHPLICTLNEQHRLPKYILIFPDKDLLTSMKGHKIETSLVIGSTLHYIIRQMDIIIDRRKMDLLEYKPGAAPLAMPKIIWIRMLKCPKSIKSPIFGLRGKFNSILEERLLDGNAENHYIMPIEVVSNEFDLQGNLTSLGKESFWKEVDKAMRKFDANEIKLRPRIYKPNKLPEAG